jgi:hypothetical protein
MFTAQMQQSHAIKEDVTQHPNEEDQTANESGRNVFPPAYVRHLAVAMSALAAIRIVLFAAAFPLTNIVDERFHLMTIRMYAQGVIPGKELPRIDTDFAKTLILYWSPEYSQPQEVINADGLTRPPYALAAAERNSALSKPFYSDKLKQWARRPNYEAQSAPFYYVVAAAWYRLGILMGLQGWRLDYWPRFLNPIAYASLVWLSYSFVRNVYPQRAFLQVAVPCLIAFFPQDVFFGMNRDVFSAPLSAAAFVLMATALQRKTKWHSALLLGAFVVGLAFLSSVSNFVLYGSLAATLLLWARRSEEALHRKILLLLGSTVAATALPGAWMLRNYLVMGDLTGGSAKIRDFHWTLKPRAEILHHPLFTWHGLSYFLTALIRSFWRGEYGWHLLQMKSTMADRFYVASSIIFLLIFAVDFVFRRKRLCIVQRFFGNQALFLVASSVLFLAAISLPFDFHDCAYPSRQLPFFVSGRIISGAILPFLLMYASGLERAGVVFRTRVPTIALLVCILLFIAGSEIRVRRPVFSSAYNFYALSGWHP